jgi:hypothetical protein
LAYEFERDEHRYHVLQEEIRELEAERAAAVGRGDPV